MITVAYIHNAIKHGNLNALQFAHEKYPSLLAAPNPQEYDNSPLHTAAQYGQLSCFEFLYYAEPAAFDPKPCLNNRNRNDFSPLILACLNGHATIVKFILDKKYNPNIVNGLSCLLTVMYCPVSARMEILDILYAHGIDPNIKTVPNTNATYYSQLEKISPLLAALLEYSDDKEQYIARLLAHPDIDVNLSVQAIENPSEKPLEISALYICATAAKAIPALERIAQQLLTMGAYFPLTISNKLIRNFCAKVNALNFATVTQGELHLAFKHLTYFISPSYLSTKIAEYNNYTFLNIALAVQHSISRGIGQIVPGSLLIYTLSETYTERITTISDNYRTWCKKDASFVQFQCQEHNIDMCIFTTLAPEVPVFLRTKMYCLNALTRYTGVRLSALSQEEQEINSALSNHISDPLSSRFLSQDTILPHPQIYQALEHRAAMREIVSNAITSRINSLRM